MLGKLLTPLTTAQPIGVVIRDIVVALGTILATLSSLGLLTAEQIAMIQKYLDAVADPAFLAAVGALITIGMMAYRAVAKSSSDKAAEAAKQIDAKLPPSEPVVIKTPAGSADIRVPARE
jgi:uncharacterized membrane protein YebE (DUF533 family)